MGVNILVFSQIIFSKILFTVSIDKNYILLNLDKKNLNNFFLIFSYSSVFMGKSLSDLFVVDFPMKSLRFQLNYYLLSVLRNIRYLVRLCLAKDEPVMSISSIYYAAGWLEREVWDMYGVFFDENFDLRRILTDYGFEGFPLRKDYPLLGFFQVRFDMEASHVIYERVNVAQELRMFEYLSPWRK